MANGNAAAGRPSGPLPVCRYTSSFNWPRGTVPATIGRAELPLAKTSDASSGSYLGASCISWRHPADAAAISVSAANRVRLVLNAHDLSGIQALEKRRGLFRVKPRVTGFNREEETGLAGERKAFRIEDRVIRLRQPIQNQHRQHGGKRREQDGNLERRRDERHP